MVNPNDYVLNPKSKRLILKTSRQAKRLEKEGLIVIEKPEPTKIEAKEPLYDDNIDPPPLPVLPPKPEIDQRKYKKKLMETMVDVAEENKSSFKDLSQKESDKLLKQLLYQKLMTKPKRHKKKKKYISSESESETESSESD